MLLKLKIINRFKEKPTESAFKKRIFKLSLSLLSLGLLGIIFIRQSNLSNSFARGMTVGIVVTSFILGLYFQWVFHHPKQLHQMYIDLIDERNKKITSITAQLTLTLLILTIFILLMLSTFAGIKLTYDLLLILLTYLLTYGFAFLHWLIGKII
ncbi:CAAX protease [Streptococcus chenjunshii]|uniref:CAAX protease n=1 Tax=Streptococcus chenjunshii TaxID=2173853 RepID=A0A372KKC3_9STRE|nr:CAAX protease [Streptococcus chenjunshii]AXQ77623.1 CAAX protease [Streptococcus chenjunshii]RFU50625.1 CAAX protease [Streptococcus chenjunshii]RFU52762.1 CAAX protease [Streptococcus chenjunshii]